MTEHERQGDYQPSDRSTASIAVTFLFIGLGIGALAALLFAPRSGRQMRKLLRRKYEDAVEHADELLERGTELFERGSDFAHTATEKVRPIARAAAKHVK
jgi:gas vesicle protein